MDIDAAAHFFRRLQKHAAQVRDLLKDNLARQALSHQARHELLHVLLLPRGPVSESIAPFYHRSEPGARLLICTAFSEGVAVTADEFRGLALELPEAVEDEHMGHPDFRVRRKLRNAREQVRGHFVFQ